MVARVQQQQTIMDQPQREALPAALSAAAVAHADQQQQKLNMQLPTLRVEDESKIILLVHRDYSQGLDVRFSEQMPQDLNGRVILLPANCLGASALHNLGMNPISAKL